jgi:hypothetical protein
MTGGRDTARGCAQSSTLRLCSGQAFSAQRASRGQTLVLVVLIMLVVAMLAALLVAVIVSNQTHIGRSGDIASLNNTVEAGLRYADYQLSYSPDGADWRPLPATESNPYPYTFGRGQFRLTLTYRPQDSGELANFIKIECAARLVDNAKPVPGLRRSRIAYKAVLLADYLRFVTNKDHSSLPAVLGTQTVTQGSSALGYATSFYGPIRANSDIKWTRSSAVGSALKMYLVDQGTFGGFARRDRIQTAGSFILKNGATLRRWDGSAWSADPGVEVYASDDGNFDVTLGVGDGIIRYIDGANQPDINQVLRNVRYQEPPTVDATDPTTGQSRYLLLTRDSGDWSSASPYYNTGWFGYGKGIYVDNFTDLQEAHDLSALRGRWMNPTPGSNYWDTAGWSYTPPGVEIILHPDNAGTTYTVPVIELVRYDKPWHKADNSGDVPADSDGKYRLYLPYPQNGVIFAEGNVRISGVLPPTWGNPNGEYFLDGTNRFFDLSVVSNGTAYIEGDIMSPNTYLANGGTISGYSAPDDIHNTRIALLARDHVCLNLTACGARLDTANTTATWSTDQWQLSATNPAVAWDFRSFQPMIAPLLYIRHAGLLGPFAAWTTAPPPVDHPAFLKLTINTSTVFAWDGSSTLFGYHPTLYTPPNLTQSPCVTDAAAGSDWEVSVRALPSGITSGAINSIVASRDVSSQNDVAIAGFQMLPAKINIDALVFAQEGSWFVLPGPWFNSSWNYLGSLLPGDPVDDAATGQTAGVPSYRMALGSIYLTTAPNNRPSIYFNGAITESHTAALGDAHDWLSKWSGPEAMINYTFDGGLRASQYTDANGNALLRIPKLPCPPGLLLWEQQ